MDILEKLYQNSGLLHVAEHVIGFMNNSTVAQCRLVNMESNNFLAKIWRKRALKEAQRHCEIKFEVSEYGIDGGPKVKTSVFELWPEWKHVLHEIESLADFKPVINLLKHFCENQVILVSAKPSPLILAAETAGWYEDGHIQRAFEILAKTSLDFNVCDEVDNTILHRACEVGSKDLVEILLNSVVKKELNVNAINQFKDTIVHCAVMNEKDETVLRHLFERRHEFDFEISQVNRESDNILHLAFGSEGIETVEIMLQWAMEKGINISDVNRSDDTILHYACEYNPEAALFLLESCDKYGIDRSVLALMANMTNEINELPIDLVKRSRVRETRLGHKLIRELEKYA